MDQEAVINHDVADKWHLPQVDHAESHNTWFSVPGMSWSSTPKLEDFPEWKFYSESLAAITDEDPEKEAELKHQWLIDNKYHPVGLEEQLKEAGDELLSKFKSEYNITDEFDENGNKKPMKITDPKTAKAFMEMQKNYSSAVTRITEELCTSQGIKDTPTDPNIIDKHLHFRIVVVNDDKEYMECLDATGAATAAPPMVLKFGGGIGIFIGWIAPDTTEVNYYEAYPVWNGNGKFSGSKVFEKVKKLCYEVFPENMRPLFKVLLKKAGFQPYE